MIVDSLTFFGDGLFGHQVDATALLQAMDGAGVQRAIVTSLKPRDYLYRPANERLASAIRSHADRLTGFARVDPWQGSQARQDLEWALGDLGMRGLFLHPWEECFQVTSSVVDPLMRVAQQHGVPVIVATGFPWLSEALQVGALAQRYRDVRIIASHGGQINISGLGTFDADIALRRHQNLSIQTTGVYREDFLENMVARHGAARVLFASGFPFFDPRYEVLRPRSAHLDDPQRQAILGGNAEALLEGRAQ